MNPASLVLVLVVVLLGGMWLPARASVTVEGGVLEVLLGPLDAFYCLRRRLRFPLQHVEGVTVAAKGGVARTGFRLPGTSLPGVIRAGSYGLGSSRDFWDVRRGDELLVVQLRPGSGYRKLVLEVADPHGDAQRLTAALGAVTA